MQLATNFGKILFYKFFDKKNSWNLQSWKLQINKFKNEENFPVASFLIPKKSRSTIFNLYKFARMADEIADDGNISADDRKAKLQQLLDSITNNGIPAFAGMKPQENLTIPFCVEDYVMSCRKGFYDIRHGVNLLQAFIQDTEKNRYESFEDTLKYCDKSAAVIGRAFLEAVKEFDCDIEKSDNICKVLQLLNHLQDLKADYKNLNRVYFDNSFFPDLEKLLSNSENPDITHGKVEILKQLKRMISSSKDMPNRIISFRVRAELYTIIQVCRVLIGKLKRNDILKKRVELNKLEKIYCAFTGLIKACGVSHRKKFATVIALKAKSSFVWPLKLLSKEKFSEMIAFYAFCRKADDIADNVHKYANPKEAIANLNLEIDGINQLDFYKYPKSPLLRELNLIFQKNDIDKQLLQEILAGQVLDLDGKMKYPLMKNLEDYCYKVASCVGLVSIKIFGYNKENEATMNEFAIKLGMGLQLINIIRDVREDAKIGRVYLPKELAVKYGFDGEESYLIAMNYDSYLPKIKPALKELATKAEGYFYSALNMLPESEKKNSKVALIMAKVYERYLEKMKAKDFEFSRAEISLSTFEKMKLLFGN